MPFLPRAALSREIFLTGGQSNMSGSGWLSELPGFASAGNVWTFRNDWTWQNPSTEPIDDPTGQIDAVSIDANPGTSSNLAFADELSRLRPGREIGIVPCAKGSSSITIWQRNLSRSTLYGSMLARALKAAEHGDIRGLLFYNGEEDSRLMSTAQTYADNFRAMVSDLRSDLGIPALPVIVTEIGPVIGSEVSVRPYWTTVQAQQRSLNGVDGIRCVSATGLADRGDGLHLSTISHCTMGLRYARAMNEMLNSLA